MTLTERELTVLTLSANGLTSKQIGWRLGFGERHIERSRTRICDKLGAINTCHAVKIGMAQGLIEEEVGP